MLIIECSMKEPALGYFDHYHKVAAIRKHKMSQEDSIMERICTFARETTWHGWAYLARDEKSSQFTRLKNFLWTFVIIGSLCGTVVFMAQNTLNFLE